MKTVSFKGKDYPIRTFNVILVDVGEREITIATQDLSDAMGNEKEVEGTEENDLDCEIYFYVDNEIINSEPEVICYGHLDEPVGFIKEIE